jgi:glycosyltransferase involved in cell wall biosynthesis
MEKPLVSVLMTVYNREKYIGEAIDSIIHSSYQNWELIIVDDKSKDKSMQIAWAYAEKDSRIKVYENESNLGDYPNRNKAASHAKGEYLKYVDADDKIYPHGLEVMVEMMEKFPDAGFGLCSVAPDKEQMYPKMLNPQEAYLTHYFHEGIFDRAPLSAIIKRSAFNKVGGFRNKRMVGDFEMWHRLSLSFSVVIMPQGIVWYRKHDAQEMNDYARYLCDYQEVSFKYLAHEENPLTKEEKNQIKKKLNMGLIRNVVRNILFKRDLRAFSKLRIGNFR